MILIIANNYPENTASYGTVFIHKRALLYKERGYETLVLCPIQRNYGYSYEGINVFKGSIEFLKQNVAVDKVEAVFIHFLTVDVYNLVESLGFNQDVIRYVWVHGFEAEAWHRRFFIFSKQPEQFLQCLDKKVNFNDKQIQLFNDIFNHEKEKYRFINVSRWFKENVVECDIGSRMPNDTIIPNPVDTSLFNYTKKASEQRLKILIIRSFTSSKYANDISLKAIKLLENQPYFKQMEILICGDGELFDELTAPLSKHANVTLKKGFLSQSAITKLHKEYGIFLCATRWDSQGVSMCEAMSSGMVIVSSNVSAIPEFVTHGESGFLCDNEPEEFAKVIDQIIGSPDLFARISENSSVMIGQICGHQSVTEKELALITQTPALCTPSPVDDDYWRLRYKELEMNFEASVSNMLEDKFIIGLAKSLIKSKFTSIASKMYKKIKSYKNK